MGELISAHKKLNATALAFNGSVIDFSSDENGYISLDGLMTILEPAGIAEQFFEAQEAVETINKALLAHPELSVSEDLDFGLRIDVGDWFTIKPCRPEPDCEG